MAKRAQKNYILLHLRAGQSITPLEALSLYGCMRLADVVFKLKKDGWDIRTTMVTNRIGKTFASYDLRGFEQRLQEHLAQSSDNHSTYEEFCCGQADIKKS